VLCSVGPISNSEDRYFTRRRTARLISKVIEEIESLSKE